jgi:hypothetical protein
MPVIQCPQCEAPIVVKENIAAGEWIRCAKCKLEFALTPKAGKASRGPGADALRQAAQVEKQAPQESALPPEDELALQPLDDGTYGQRRERKHIRGTGGRPAYEMPISRKKPRRRRF